MIWINIAITGLILFSSYYYFRTPRNEYSWLLSIVVSAFYGPCLALVITLLIITYFLSSSFLLAWSVLLIPLFLLLIITRQKWIAFKKHDLILDKSLGLSFFIAPFIQPRPQLPTYFKSRDCVDIPVDFFFNDNPTAPLIFFFFGGGFENGNQKQLRLFSVRLRDMGYHVAAVGYRQLPYHPWPKSLEDAQDCVTQIISCPPDGIKPSSFHLLGRSAGGFLALHTSLLKFEKPIETCTAIYPVTDVKMWSEEESANAVLESRRRVNALVQQNMNYASEISLLNKSFPLSIRYFVVSGDADPVVDVKQTYELQSVWKSQGIKHECLILRTETHGFDFNMNSWATRLFFHTWQRFMKSSN